MKHSINLSDFDGTPLAQLRAAARYLQEHPDTTLHIAPGEYRLEDADAARLQTDVMNGVHGENPHFYLFNRKTDFPVAMRLVGVRGCTIESEGARFYADGFSGKENSAARRASLAKAMGLPEDLSANALISCINLLLSEAEYESFAKNA